MAYVLIEHRVGDFETFRQVYWTTPSAASGSAPGRLVFRVADDPDNVIVMLEWDTVEHAATSPALWSSSRRWSGRQRLDAAGDGPGRGLASPSPSGEKGGGMVYVVLEHEIHDFDTLKQVYTDDAERRRRMGCLGGRIWRGADDPTRSR